MKEYFQRYNTNEKHKTIIFFQSNLSAPKESFQICSTLRILKDYKDVLVFWRWTHIKVTYIFKSSLTLFEVCKNEIVLLRARAS